MNKRTFKGLAAVVALFAAGMVNAASISLIPSTTTVNANDTFTLTVSGSGFDNDIIQGSLLLSWDTTYLSLTSSSTGIVTALQGIGFNGALTAANTTVAGQVDIDLDTPLSIPPTPVVTTPSGNINFLTLDFTATGAMTLATQTVINSSVGSGGIWADGSFGEISIDPYGSATLNAVPVPAAVWLFGSGLIGLAGIARRSTTKAAA